jgi:hypothetical protein
MQDQDTRAFGMASNRAARGNRSRLPEWASTGIYNGPTLGSIFRDAVRDGACAQ